VTGYQIQLVFDDGCRKTVDFAGWLKGPLFEPLRERRFFKKFFLDGNTVAWPNGADIAPETLYEAEGVDTGHNKHADSDARNARRSR
jgi:hypothetical protein